uniref:Transient receptor potential cation channel 4 n=1 Tax=Cryptocotyle lingua TaxID=66766 RepID=A0A7U0TJ10_9TREM|nr:transient receptor potential cation channel 4 [Cryptocotyle lingua]
MRTHLKAWQRKNVREKENEATAKKLLTFFSKQDVAGFEEYVSDNRKTLGTLINDKRLSRTPTLHTALQIQEFEFVKILVESLKADVNITDRNGVTALHVAAKSVDKAIHLPGLQKYQPPKPEGIQPLERGTVHHNIINYLVQKGADPDARDCNGSTPLHYAVSRGNLRAVKQLIADKANTEATDVRMITPLLLAAQKGHVDIIQTLLDHGAKCFAMDDAENNVLHFVCSQQNTEALKKVINVIETHAVCKLNFLLNTTNKSGGTAFFLAAAHVNSDCLQFLLEKGADPKFVNMEGAGCFHFAVRGCNARVIKLLAEHGVELNWTTKYGETPLCMAVRLSSPEMTGNLLEVGADVDCENADGETPLMLACRDGKISLVNTILQFKPNLNKRNLKGENAIFMAVQNQHLEVLKLLLGLEAVGEALDCFDLDGNRAIHKAVEIGNLEIYEALNNAMDSECSDYDFVRPNNKGQTIMHLAAKFGHLSIVDGCFLNSDGDTKGNTAVHYAAKYGHTDILEWCTQRQLPISMHTQNNLGRTPLSYAAGKDHLQSVKVLLKTKGCSVNHKDKMQMTPLFVACLKGHTRIVLELLKNGADPTIRVAENHEVYPGWNALNAAVQNKQTECARTLLDSGHGVELLRNKTAYGKGWETPFRHMIRMLPEAAQIVMDRHTMGNELPSTQKDYSTTFHFNPLEDTWELIEGTASQDKSGARFQQRIKKLKDSAKTLLLNKTEKMEHPLTMMVKFERGELLQHELVIASLALKRIDRIAMDLLNILFYLLFLACFTAFMLMTVPTYSLMAGTNQTVETLCTNMMNNNQKAYVLYIDVVKYGIMVLAVFSLLKEMIQFFTSWGEYVTFENGVELSIYSLSIATAVDTTDCMRLTGLREPWQWETGSVGVMLAWINLLLFIQRTTPIGIYLGIFSLILSNLAKLTIVFSPFLIAFALAFHLLMGNQIRFNDMRNTFSSTISMFSGEVGMADSLFSRYDPGAPPEQMVYYSTLSYLLFVIFVTFMAIALMNMLTGIAVGDVEEIKSQANLETVQQLVGALVDSGSLIEKCKFGLSVREKYTYYPRREGGLRRRLFRFLYNYIGKSARSEEQVQSKVKGMQVKETLTTLQERVKQLRSTFCSLSDTISSLHKAQSINSGAEDDEDSDSTDSE